MVWIEKKVVLKSMIKNERKVKKEFKFLMDQWCLNKLIDGGWRSLVMKREMVEGLRVDSSDQFAHGLILKSEKEMLKRVKKEWFCSRYSMKVIEKVRDDRGELRRDREGVGKGRKKIWVWSRCI